MVTSGISCNFSDAEQQESEHLWTDYQSKLSPEMKIVYVVSNGQIIQSPVTIVGQVDRDSSISVLRTLNHHH
jgi:hypothetical protein